VLSTPVFWDGTPLRWAIIYHVPTDCTLETSGTAHRMTQRHIPEDWIFRLKSTDCRIFSK